MRSSFPVRSDEYEDGSTKRREYLNCLERLVDAMSASGNVEMLQVSELLQTAHALKRRLGCTELGVSRQGGSRPRVVLTSSLYSIYSQSQDQPAVGA